MNINKNNCNNSEIILTLDIIKKIDEKKEKKQANFLEQYALYIFLVILILIIFFGYKWFMNFKDKNNDID